MRRAAGSSSRSAAARRCAGSRSPCRPSRSTFQRAGETPVTVVCSEIVPKLQREIDADRLLHLQLDVAARALKPVDLALDRVAWPGRQRREVEQADLVAGGGACGVGIFVRHGHRDAESRRRWRLLTSPVMVPSVCAKLGERGITRSMPQDNFGAWRRLLCGMRASAIPCSRYENRLPAAAARVLLRQGSGRNWKCITLLVVPGRFPCGTVCAC